MKSILVTGGSGSVGKMLLPFLLGYGYTVDNYDLYKHDDIFDEKKLVKRLKGKDAVIHLAAIPHPFLIGVKDEDYWRVNVEGTKRVYESCVKAGVKKFIYTSSGCVYGFWGGYCRPDQFPIIESQHIPSREEGLTVYGETKIAAEQYLMLQAKRNRVRVVVLRIDGPSKMHNRVEWMYGMQNLDYRVTVASCPAYHFFTRITPENLYQIVSLAVERDLRSYFEIFNVANQYVHWSIDVQRWIKLHFPKVKNYTKGNESLYSSKKAQEMLGYISYPAEDRFPDRGALEKYYYQEPYFGKLGKP